MLVYAAITSRQGTTTSHAVIGLGMLGLGAYLLAVCYRLIAHRPRRDGGLFSPLLLRAAGVVMVLFMVVSVVLAFTTKMSWSWWVALKVLTMTSFVAGCFHLAARRQEAPRALDRPID